MTMTMTMTMHKVLVVVVVLLFTTTTLLMGQAAAKSNQQIEETCSATDGSCSATDTTTTDPSADPADDDDEDDCQDTHPKCEFWARLGECEINPKFMKSGCPKSCQTCNEKPIKVISDVAGVPQVYEAIGGVTLEMYEQVLEESKEYMAKVELPSQALLDMCTNEHKSCAVWAAFGECTNNDKYMKKSCAPVCQSCDYLSVETRCPLDPNAPEAWKPGDLNTMFQRLATDPEIMAQYQTKVLSSPSSNDKDDDAPWVLLMENLLTEEETERLIELGHVEGYERSSDVGALRPDGTTDSVVSDVRTSTNAWCQHECYEDPVALRVIHRLSNLTQINETNSEYLQLLRYEPGQYYKRHHDYIALENKRQQGPRILTVYIYLNDVEEGGGTDFPVLKTTVTPKRGRAVLWPSVLDEEPHTKDPRTEHQALPVKQGIKYGANAWFHLRDFKTPNRNHCQG